MSVELICSALGVPADRWPPDHYELLGLPQGEADPARVEAHVVERMERLRGYQLAHPDAVTDAMNRLAQALVCLTDPALRRRYDADLGIAPPPAAPPPPTPLPTSALAESRRALYRRRVVLRRWRSAWGAAGRCLADADRPFATRAELVELIQTLAALRAMAARDGAPLTGESGQPGALVLGLARQALLATALTDASPTYRRGLAGDWAAADQRLAAAERAVRGRLFPGLKRWRQRVRRAARAAAVTHLDLTLVLAGLAALAVALVRSRG